MRSKTPAKRHARLSAEQIKRVGQFNDYAFDNPNLNFDEVARKELGSNPFPKTPNGRKFSSECRAVFDLERKK